MPARLLLALLVGLSIASAAATPRAAAAEAACLGVEVTLTGAGFTEGTGDDDITTGADSDLVDVGAGVDRVRGGAGNDDVQGNAGNDALARQDGASDTSNGGDGADVHLDTTPSGCETTVGVP